MLIKKGNELLNGIDNNYTDLKCKDNLTYIYLKNKLSDPKPNVISKFNQEEDDLFLNAIRIYSNINTLILFNKDTKSAFEFYKEKYKNNYLLYGLKEIELSKSNVIKAFYQLLYYRHQLNHINDYLKYFNSYIEYFKDFGKMGEDDILKISLLIIVPKNSNIHFYSLSEEANTDYLVYVPKNEEEQWICASLFFNKNSLDFLEKQDLKFYLKSDNKNCWDKMNNFIKNINKYVAKNDRHRILFYSSTILYFLGHRANNDFDFMIFCKEDDTSFHQMLREFELHENSVHKNENSKGIYDFSYINTKDEELRREYYEEYYDKWAQEYGQAHSASVRKWEEIYAFGKHHMYYLGIKSTILAQDIIRRAMRNRPRGITDLIALRKRYGMKINIPKPPKTKELFYKVKDLSLEEKSKLLSKGGTISNKYGYEELRVEEACDQNKFVNTIVWALKERYNMDFTISEVMIELGIERNDSIKNTFKIRTERIQKEEEKKQNVKKEVIKTKDITTGEIKRSIKIKDVNIVKGATTLGSITRDETKKVDEFLLQRNDTATFGSFTCDGAKKVVKSDNKENNSTKLVIKIGKKN